MIATESDLLLRELTVTTFIVRLAAVRCVIAEQQAPPPTHPRVLSKKLFWL